MSLEAAIQSLADAIKGYTDVVKAGFTLREDSPAIALEQKPARGNTAAEAAASEIPGKKSKTEEPEIQLGSGIEDYVEKTEVEIRAEALDAPDGYCFKAQMELSKGGNREGVKAVLDTFGAKTLKDVKTAAIPEFHKALLAALEKKNAAPEEKVVEGVVEIADELADQPLEKDDPEFAKLFDVATGTISVPYLKIKKDPDHKEWADEIMAKFGVARPSLVPRGRLKELQIEISNYTARASAGA